MRLTPSSTAESPLLRLSHGYQALLRHLAQGTSPTIVWGNPPHVSKLQMLTGLINPGGCAAWDVAKDQPRVGLGGVLGLCYVHRLDHLELLHELWGSALLFPYLFYCLF